MMMDKTITIIQKCAEIPSFSSFEERIHPLIFHLAGEIDDVRVETVHDRNILIQIPGKKETSPVALSAHLDKINHFGENPPEKLFFQETDEYIDGQLDDTVGLGLCLRMMQLSVDHDFPPLYLFLTEMEESFGLRFHPHLLRNEGKDVRHGMGAERLSDHIMNHHQTPSVILTIDTTPLFKGKPGVALYSEHWEYNKMEPSADLISKTKDVVEQFTSIHPGILLSNNTNDYLVYGKKFNGDSGIPVPCLALEPAIFPYHQKNERVFKKDIETTEMILATFLERYEG